MASRKPNIPETEYVVNRKATEAFADSGIQTAPDEVKKAIKLKDAFVSADIPASEDTSKKTVLSSPISVGTDIPIAPDEDNKSLKTKVNVVSSEIPTADDTVKKNILDKPTGVSGDITTAPNESITQIKQDASFVNTEIPTAEDTEKKSILNKPTNVSIDIPTAGDELNKHIKLPDAIVSDNTPTSPDEINKAYKSPAPIVSSEIPTAEDTSKKTVYSKPTALSSDIPVAQDELKRAIKSPEPILSSETLTAEDTTKKIVYAKPTIVSSEIPTAPDEIKKSVKRPDALASAEIPVSEDTQKKYVYNKPVLANSEVQPSQDEITKHIARPFAVVNGEINASEDDIGKMPRFELPFVGRWAPSDDALNIGPENYSVLQNLRYKNDGLEGVDGNSRINTSGLGAAIKSGIHLKTNYTEDSFVIVQRDDDTQAELIVNKTNIPDAGAFAFAETVTIVANDSDTIFLKTTADSGTYPAGSGFKGLIVNEGIYTCIDFATELQSVLRGNTPAASALKKGGGATEIIILSVSYSTTTKLFTITTDDPQYKLKYSFTSSSLDTEMGLTADDLTWGQTIVSDTAIVTQTSLVIEDSAASLARMSLLPTGHAGICDQKNNYIWAGDEMPLAAFILSDQISGGDLEDYNDKYSVDRTTIINNNLTDSDNVVAISSAVEVFGDTDNVYTVTEGTVPNTFKYTYDSGGSAPLFATNGLEAGHAIIISNSTGFTDNNALGYFKVIEVDVGDGYFVVENAYGVPEASKTLGDNNGIRTWGKALFIGATRKITSLSVTVSTGNTQVATLVGSVWTGDDFETLTITDGTSVNSKTMAGDGTIEFTTNTDDAEPAYFSGYYLYWYKFSSAQDWSASISNITMNAEIQDIKDLWDGIYRTAILFQFFDQSAKTYTDYTLEVSKKTFISQSSGEDPYVATISAMVADKDFITVVFPEPIIGLKIGMKDENTNLGLAAVHYSSNGVWSAATMVSDTTSRFYQRWRTSVGGAISPFANNGIIQWRKPTNETKTTIDGTTGYAYRVIVNATLSGTVTLDTCHGIPSYRAITNQYLFSFNYQNRAFWLNSLSDKEHNRGDYSKTNAPDVYNGFDASGRENERSLRFGSFEPLTCAIRLFNLYGDALDEIALVLKYGETYMLTGNTPKTFRIKQISDNVGCPAWRTLRTAEVSFKPEGGGPEQNIAMWLSEQGPVMFRNNILSPIIVDIEQYFDPKKSTTYINKDAIEIAAGGFNTKYREYNLVIPTGESTVNNVWLVFDLVRQKWYEKTGETDIPQGFIDVEDVYGNKYLYGYTAAGYLLRIEDPGTLYWSDGETEMTHVIQTADLLMTKSLWDNVLLYAHKILFLDNPADEGTITIDFYIDGNPAPERYTATTISFTSTDTISGTFDTTVFKVGMTLFIEEKDGTDADGVNDGTYTIATVSATTITVAADNTVTTQTAAAAGTVTLKTLNLPYQKTMNETDGFRYRNLISHLNRIGYSVKIKYTIEGCTSTKPKLLGHGLLWSQNHEDLLDKDDWA